MRASLITVFTLVAAAACSKQTPEPEAAPPPPDAGAEDPASTEGAALDGADSYDPQIGDGVLGASATVSVETDVPASFGPVYFGFDSAVLSEESFGTLDLMADYLMRTRDAVVTITGHCDDRGTPEYNLALGEERARAVRDYLVDRGIERERLSLLSYGEERPAVDGEGEMAWAKNRRAELEHPEQP